MTLSQTNGQAIKGKWQKKWVKAVRYYWSSTAYSSNVPWYLYFDDETVEVRHTEGMTSGKGAAVRVFSKYEQ